MHTPAAAVTGTLFAVPLILVVSAEVLAATLWATLEKAFVPAAEVLGLAVDAMSCVELEAAVAVADLGGFVAALTAEPPEMLRAQSVCPLVTGRSMDVATSEDCRVDGQLLAWIRGHKPNT